MERLCGRPGCSDPAAVAYGMVPTDLVFWLSALPLDPDPDGVLCRRHADAMVVPRGWTLDDRRDPDLHLFRPPAPVPPAPAARRPRSANANAARQLDLGLAATGDESSPVDTSGSVENSGSDAPDGGEPEPWSPRFDDSDDLDGLLSARGPLLSRAFRTAGRADR